MRGSCQEYLPSILDDIPGRMSLWADSEEELHRPLVGIYIHASLCQPKPQLFAFALDLPAYASTASLDFGTLPESAACSFERFSRLHLCLSIAVCEYDPHLVAFQGLEETPCGLVQNRRLVDLGKHSHGDAQRPKRCRQKAVIRTFGGGPRGEALE